VKIVQITPGAGKMYCGGCLRDNALVKELRNLGHSVTMLPLYLPPTLETENQGGDTPIFFGGISVYLEQKFAFFRKAPRWVHKLISAPGLLKAAAGSAAQTKPSELGELTISMLRGEEGHQARELDELITWLKGNEKPDIVSLSNVLLVGLVRRIKAELNVPVICSLQGEDFFLDNLPEEHRYEAWETLAQRADDIDLFIAPSSYFAGIMQQRLRIPSEKMKVVYNGISLDGFVESRDSRADRQTTNRPGPRPSTVDSRPPTLGYFARMCPEKGLDLLIDAYILLRQNPDLKNVKLKVGGSCGPADEPFVKIQREKLKTAGLEADVEFHPNLTLEQKIAFLKSLTVFSVPALYGEAFGLYIIEAMAAGVPVVQPRHGPFAEILRACPGGVIAEPNAEALAKSIENLFRDPAYARDLGDVGRHAVIENFSARRMASEISQLCRQVILARKAPATV
jgi:glycosyltransferase involved in cell wall biosynthesis